MSTFSTSSRQKRLKTLSFLHFWLRNVLRATTACTFSTLFPHRNLQKWSETVSFLHFWLGNVLRATTACTFSTSQLPKVVRHWGVFYIFTSKCASRHNGVHFFDIATSKSGPNPWCFVHFDFEMCFAPQRRTLFWHLNFQKWSDAEVFCTFWLGNVLRATTACTFSTSQLPKVVRTWCVLYILTWKCASRHNGVQFFISHLASWLRTRRFSEPTFRLSGATNHWKNTVFRDFPTFSRICIFFLLTLSLLIFSLLIFLFSLPLPCSAFHLSILSEVWLLNFLRLLCTTKLAQNTFQYYFVLQSLHKLLPSTTLSKLWREAHLEVKMYKTHHGRTTFGSCDVEKVHAVVARSTFRSQNVQNTPWSDHFWKLRCRKCTLLWREAHFEVEMYKTHHSRS